MPVSGELTTEVRTAIDDIIESQKSDIESKDSDDPNNESDSKDDSSDDQNDGTKDKSKDNENDDSENAPEDDLGSDSDDKGDSEDDSDPDLNTDSDSSDDSSDDPSKKPGKKPDSKSALVPISDAALTAAVNVGIDLGAARQFPGEVSLRQAIASIDAAKEANRPVEEEVDLFENLKMDPEEFEPEAIKMYDALVDVVKKQHDELKELKNQTVDYTKQSEMVNQDASTREMTSWFNIQTEKLGKDFQEALGEGEIDSLTPGSSQRAKREEIANRMAISMAGYNAAGIQAPPREELFQEAAGLVLKEEYQQIREKKLIVSLKKQSSQHINRANSRGIKQEQSPMDETAAMLDKRYNLK